MRAYILSAGLLVAFGVGAEPVSKETGAKGNGAQVKVAVHSGLKAAQVPSAAGNVTEDSGKFSEVYSPAPAGTPAPAGKDANGAAPAAKKAAPSKSGRVKKLVPERSQGVRTISKPGSKAKP